LNTNYPKRPAFFSHKFCRLLFKACVANDIGPDGCWLLTVIAHTEDAKGYRGAVSFFNMQLAPLVGLGSVDALDRVRRKAIEAGWLHYSPGAKGVAGKYWVTIPEQFTDVDDAPSDENAADYAPGYLRENADESRRKEGVDSDTSAKTRTKAEGMCGTNREESAEHSSLFLPLSLFAADAAPATGSEPATKAEPESADTPEARPAAKPSKPKATPTPKKPRERNPLFDAVAEVCGLDAATAGSLIGKVAAALAAAEPVYTPDDVRAFGRRFWELCPHARGERTRPNPGELQKWIGRLRADSKAPPVTPAHPTKPNPFLTPEALSMVFDPPPA
jgi:hypothetical protein